MAVLGIGAGLFVIIFFGIISAAICLLGARSKVPGFFYFIGILISLIVILVVVLAPKSNSVSTIEYDPTWRTRAGVLAVGTFAVVCGLVGTILFVCVPHVRASRVVDDSGSNNIVY